MASQDEINQREWEEPSNWSGGTYSSKLDTRVWVPKRPMTGSGDTLNFAQPGARTFIVAVCVILGVVLSVVVLLALVAP